MYRLLLACLLFSPCLLASDIYRWIDDGGLVTYSDRPGPGGEALNPNVRKSGPPPASPRTFEGRASEGIDPGDRGPYEAFEIVAPADGTILSLSDGPVAISLLLIPSLVEGDRLQLIIDGVPVQGDQLGTQVAINGLQVGSHQAQARVLDFDDQPIAATPITRFHIRAASPETDQE